MEQFSLTGCALGTDRSATGRAFSPFHACHFGLFGHPICPKNVWKGQKCIGKCAKGTKGGHNDQEVTGNDTNIHPNCQRREEAAKKHKRQRTVFRSSLKGDKIVPKCRKSAFAGSVLVRSLICCGGSSGCYGAKVRQGATIIPRCIKGTCVHLHTKN